MSSRTLSEKIILLMVLTLCLASFGCRATPTYKNNIAAQRVTAARQALTKFDKLQNDINGTWATALEIPATAKVGAQLQILIDKSGPKIKQQAPLLTAASKDLAAADKLLLPADYHAYIRLLIEATTKKQKAQKMTVEILNETTNLVKDLPADATPLQIPPTRLSQVTEQEQAIRKLIAEAGKLQNQAEAKRKANNINL